MMQYLLGLNHERPERPIKPQELSVSAKPNIQGFTLVEVMVSMVMTVTFLMVTMQTFLSAAVLRAKATEYNDAYNWIQEDFEKVLTKAKEYEMQAIPYSSQCDAGTLATNFISSSSQGLGGATNNLGVRRFGGSELTLLRKASTQGTINPSQLLNVNYSMTRPDGKTILKLETKVLVYAALNCPKS